MKIENGFPAPEAPKSPKYKIGAEHESYPLEREFVSFQEALKNIPFDYEGETEKDGFVRPEKLYAEYKKYFGDAGIARSTLLYRLEGMGSEDFPGDFLALDDTPSGKKEFVINPKNTELLKKLFMPPVDKELEEIRQQTETHEEDFHTMNELEDLGEPVNGRNRNSRISDERGEIKKLRKEIEEM